MHSGSEEEARAALSMYRSSDAEVSKEIEEMSRNNNSTEGRKGAGFSDLFSSLYLRPFLCLVFMMLAQQSTGFIAIATKSNDIFLKIKGPLNPGDSDQSIDPAQLTISIALLNILIGFLSTFINKMFSRRPSYFVLSLLQVVILFALGMNLSPSKNLLSSPQIGIILMFLFQLNYNLGLGPLPFIYMGESLPSSIRSLVPPILVTINGIATGVMLQIFNSLIDAYGYDVIFFSLGFLTLVFFSLSFHLMDETKGLSMNEVDEKYEKLRIKKSQ